MDNNNAPKVKVLYENIVSDMHKKVESGGASLMLKLLASGMATANLGAAAIVRAVGESHRNADIIETVLHDVVGVAAQFCAILAERNGIALQQVRAEMERQLTIVQEGAEQLTTTVNDGRILH